MTIHRSIREHVKKADFPIAADLHRQLAIVADEVAAALTIPPSKVIVFINSGTDLYYVVEGRAEEIVPV